MTARVVAPSFSRGKEATYGGTGESYVSFLGPRDTVEMATDLLKKKVRTIISLHVTRLNFFNLSVDFS